MNSTTENTRENTERNNHITLTEIIPYIFRIQLRNDIPLPAEVLINLRSILTWTQWGDISSRTYSKEIILSKELFKHLEWSKLISRHHLNSDLVKKIFLKERYSAQINNLCIEWSYFNPKYFDELSDELKWKYFYHQDFKMSTLKSFINKVAPAILKCNLKNKIQYLSSNPNFKPNLTSDLQLLPLINWDNHLAVHQYTSDEILFKILPMINPSDQDELIRSKCWQIQKDLSPNLIQKIIGLASNTKDKVSIEDKICQNPFQDLKKNKLIEDRIKKGHFNVAKICEYRQLPLWFIDRYFFYLSIPELFCYHHQQITEHFLVRQIQKYLGFDPTIQKQTPNFLAHLIRYYPFDLLFLRALSELVIKNRTLDFSITNSYWKTLSSYQKLNFEFIKDYKYLLDLEIVQTSQKITIELLEWLQENKKINQSLLVRNETFSNLKFEIQEKYASIPVLGATHSLFVYNHDKKGQIEIVYQATAFNNICNIPGLYLEYYRTSQDFVPAEDRIDWSKLEIGKTYYSTYTTFKQPLGFYFKPSKTNTLSRKSLKELEITYQTNPVLCRYPTFLRISYPLDQSREAYGINYNSLPNPSVPKWNYDHGILTRCFTVLDVKYINDFEPFRASY